MTVPGIGPIRKRRVYRLNSTKTNIVEYLRI